MKVEQAIAKALCDLDRRKMKARAQAIKAEISETTTNPSGIIHSSRSFAGVRVKATLPLPSLRLQPRHSIAFLRIKYSQEQSGREKILIELLIPVIEIGDESHKSDTLSSNKRSGT